MPRETPSAEPGWMQRIRDIDDVQVVPAGTSQIGGRGALSADDHANGVYRVRLGGGNLAWPGGIRHVNDAQPGEARDYVRISVIDGKIPRVHAEGPAGEPGLVFRVDRSRA